MAQIPRRKLTSIVFVVRITLITAKASLSTTGESPLPCARQARQTATGPTTYVAKLAKVHVERVALGVFFLVVLVLPSREIGLDKERILCSIDQSGPPRFLLFLQYKVARPRCNRFFGFLTSNKRVRDKIAARHDRRQD